MFLNKRLFKRGGEVFPTGSEILIKNISFDFFHDNIAGVFLTWLKTGFGRNPNLFLDNLEILLFFF